MSGLFPWAVSKPPSNNGASVRAVAGSGRSIQECCSGVELLWLVNQGGKGKRRGKALCNT